VRIGHLDADCFYVSAERVRDPWLNRRPVGVLGNNGACVIAKSYEMKALGVRTGEPIWDAVRTCPDGIYVKRDFAWYEVLSRKILDIVRDESPVAEYYSIDEFFFQPGHGCRAESIRDRILEETGLPVTVAIARTRTLSKLFAETVKPFGAIEVTDPKHEEEILSKLPVTEVAGIAGRRAAKLHPYGVRTCLDFVRMPRSVVKSLLTVVGEQLWWELQGRNVLALQTQKPPTQAVSRGGGFTATSDPTVVFAWAVRHLERLIEEFDFHQVRAGKLTLWLEYRDAATGLGEARLDSPSDRFDLLLEATREALRQAWKPGWGARKMDLIASNLHGPGPIQRTLFESPDPRQDALTVLKRGINAEVGRFALRSGATLPLAELYRDPASGYEICDVKGKICF